MANNKQIDEFTLLRRMMMLRLGLTQRSLAEQWETSQSFVSQLISGKCRSELHEQKFAEIIGMPREQLFDVSKSRARRPAKPQLHLPFVAT